MRVVIIFFLTLCFSFSRASDHVDTDIYLNSINSSTAQNVETSQQINSTNTSQGFTISKNSDLRKSKVNFLIVESEEEDHVFATKYILLTNYLSALSFAFNSNYSYSYLKASLPFYTQLSNKSSYKYITQRSLRIWSKIFISCYRCNFKHLAGEYSFIPILLVLNFSSQSSDC